MPCPGENQDPGIVQARLGQLAYARLQFEGPSPDGRAAKVLRTRHPGRNRGGKAWPDMVKHVPPEAGSLPASPPLFRNRENRGNSIATRWMLCWEVDL